MVLVVVVVMVINVFLTPFLEKKNFDVTFFINTKKRGLGYFGKASRSFLAFLNAMPEVPIVVTNFSKTLIQSFTQSKFILSIKNPQNFKQLYHFVSWHLSLKARAKHTKVQIFEKKFYCVKKILLLICCN